MTAARLWMVSLLVMAALIASVGLAAARLAWHQAGHTSLLPETLDAAPAAPNTDPAFSTEAIVALAPFGTARALNAPQAPATARTDLGLELRGVLVFADPAKSLAFIAAASATQGYRVGDTVNGADLIRIGDDSVDLQVGDAQVTLTFDGDTDTPATAIDIAEAPPANDPLEQLRLALVPGRGSLDLRDAPPPETIDQHIDMWRQRIIADPVEVMQTIGLELTDRGYKVTQDPNIGVTMAGLRPGDLVTRLNGQEVGDLDRDRRLYDEVAAQGIARLEVMRSGETVLMTFPLR